MKKIILLLFLTLIINTCSAQEDNNTTGLTNNTLTTELLNQGIPGASFGSATWFVGVFEGNFYNPIVNFLKLIFPENPGMDVWSTTWLPVLVIVLAIKILLSMFQNKIDLILWVIILISIIWFALSAFAQISINSILTDLMNSNITNNLTSLLGD